METDDAKSISEVVAFAEEAGCGGNVGEIVEMDCGCGEVVFGFD